jgi:hypothetical protein
VPPNYDCRRGLRHIQKDNRPIFLTFTTDHRWKLPVEARDIVLRCCVKENGHRFDLHTAVVMPDHAQLSVSPLRRADGRNFSLSEIMHAVKGASPGKSTYCWLAVARSGRKNSSIMFCARMTVLQRKLTTSARIRFGQDW